MGNVKSYQDLNVYKRLYEAMLSVHKKILSNLPNSERFGLIDQMRRASKVPLAILAEDYAKKNYRKDWIRYINDAIGECNEMVTHLSCCRDIYKDDFDKIVLEDLLEEYNIAGKQLYCLGKSWAKGLSE